MLPAVVKRIVWVAVPLLVLVAVVCMGTFYYYFVAEHVMIELPDAKTGLNFSATCKYSDYSYRTFIVVKSPQGREISRNEIPYSADSLSACMNDPYYRITSLQVDSAYTKLYASITDQSRIAEVPLLLRELDLPVRPWEESQVGYR